MTDDARNLINSTYGLNIAYAISKYPPEWMGRRIASSIADFIAGRKSWKMVRTTRCNQWVVNGEHYDKKALDQLVAKNFRNIAFSIFDYYRHMNDPAASLRTVVPHPLAVQFVQRPKFADRGIILAGIHMTNFDFLFQLGGLAGIHAITMTLAELNAAYQKQWEMRSKSGLQFLNASIGSLKSAINYLRRGGMVITAIDRPDPNPTYQPKFFGHPSAMPIHHIFMAVKAHVPIVVTGIIKHSDGKYHFFFSDPIEMQPHPDRHAEIVLNAEKVLDVVAGFITRDTTQWSMTFPVWPDLMPQFLEMDR